MKVNRSGRFNYSFRAGAGLSGKAVFKKLATKSFRVPSSGKVTLKMRLSPRSLRCFAGSGTIKTKVTVTLRNGSGSSVASRALTLKR